MALSSFVRPKIHGHRGCRGLFPENTLPAFLHALALGVDVLEMDVVISADNQVVVSHEPWLSAQLGLSPTGHTFTSHYERNHNLYQLPYSTIRQCQLGILPHPHFPEQQLAPTYRPLLSEVIFTIEAACQRLGRSPVGYSIEIKSTPITENIFHPSSLAFVELVIQDIPSVILPRTTLLCFDPRVLQMVRSVSPTLSICLLTETPFIPSSVFDELGFTPDVFGPAYQLLSEKLILELIGYYSSLQLVPWTINESQDLITAATWKISAITTDYPDRAFATIRTLE